MSDEFSLIVADTSPLITLAIAEELDLLLAPRLPVIIPDMVYFEATHDLAKLGAQSLARWIAGRLSLVSIATTEVYEEFEVVRQARPAARSRGRGELAAIEVLRSSFQLDHNLRALLLFEDSDLIRARVAVLMPDNVAAITTSDFLDVLEDSKRIQSAEHILDKAVAAGRAVPRRRVLSDDEVSTAATLRRQIEGQD